MSFWIWLLVIAAITLITWGGFCVWLLWHYLSWVRSRRIWFLENGNRPRRQ